MGLFAHHSSSSRQAKSSDKLYISIRSPDTSANAATSWFLTTSEKRRPLVKSNSSNSDGHERQKSRKSLLSFRGSRESNISTKSRSSSMDESTLADDMYEFSMKSGQFAKTSLTQHEEYVTDSITTKSPSTSSQNNPDTSALLRIEIPHSLYSDTEHLSDVIERTLNRHASAPSDEQDSSNNSTPTDIDIDTQTRLKFVLLTLQSESLLPPASSLDIEKLMHFTQANLEQFRTEIDQASPTSISTTDHEPNATANTNSPAHTKEVSYTAHLSESDRLRTHFGHHNKSSHSSINSPLSSSSFSSPTFFPANFSMRNNNGYDVYGDKVESGYGYGYGGDNDGNEYGREGEEESVPHIYGGIGAGGFWVTRPQVYGAGPGTGRKERNVYGGLM